MKSRILKLAQRQLADYDDHCPGSMFRDGAGILTVPEAYDLQIQVALLRIQRGEVLACHKVGCTSEAIQKQLGLNEPVWAHLFARELRQTGTVIDCSQYECLAIEGEFAFRMAEDIPSRTWLLENRTRAIAAFFPVIELHNYVFRAQPPTTKELVANNAINVGAVLPAEETRVRDVADLAGDAITIFRNEETVAAASAAEIDAGPFAALLWLADRLRDFGLQLKRGQIVLAGSPLHLFPVHAGERIAVRCRRLGSVECSIRDEARSA
jgi:2-keto-4-pentenoate hydratase